MDKLKKLIIGLCGVAAIGLITYYVIVNDTKSGVVKKNIKNPEGETIANGEVIQDSILAKITSALSIEEESFTPTNEEGVYTNTTKDKILVLKEDVWKTMIRKTQRKFPVDADDCVYEYPIPDLKNYTFIGLLTHFTYNKDSKLTTAYRAIEIRNGKLKSYAGGNICCDCEEGEPLVAQKIEAVIVK
ncbi:hypothetical protein [Flavobacterium sp.]|uniref:hypothetical protein n=1 Tax=Flavobacterium sp. TaxID=239 RepID=UPI00261B41DC|nr:hypothetical protein [Flavobacterium sp.]